MIVPALVSTRAEYGHLFDIYVPIAGAVFVIVVLAIAVAVLRYRHNARPTRRTGADMLEGSYAVVLVCVVAFLLFETFGAEHKVDTVAEREHPSLTVNVTAARWEWEFNYPGYDITARSGTVGYQPLVVPADEAIRFNLASQDVIHSMWIPGLRFKRDLIRGTIEHVTLTFTQLGLLDGQCAEFCGEGHAAMIFRVDVLAPAAFARWLAVHRGAATT
jgi:cytochrome c oxidase subunit 2